MAETAKHIIKNRIKVREQELADAGLEKLEDIPAFPPEESNEIYAYEQTLIIRELEWLLTKL